MIYGRFRLKLMKPVKNSFWSRHGRYVTLAVTATAFAGLVMFLHWRHDRHNAQLSPTLNGVASEMRKRCNRRGRIRRKTASEMLRDIREQDRDSDRREPECDSGVDTRRH